MPKKPPDKLLQAVKLKHDNPSITQDQLAQLTGTTKQNISKYFTKHKLDWKKTQSYKELEADILSGYKQRILEKGITDKKIKEADLKEIAVSFGIFDDKEDRKRNKTAIKDLMSDVIEKMSKKRRTTITIEQTDSITVDKVDNNVIEAELVSE